MNFKQNPLKNNLHTIVQLARADAEKRFRRAKIDITPLQFAVLSIIEHTSVTINEIARNLSVKAPSLVPAVDALEKKKLLHRKNDTRDRRKVQLLISPRGVELLNRLPKDDKSDALNRAFNKLSFAGQKQLLALLEELIGNFGQ